MGSKTHPRVLVVAGSDSGGGAGIEADIKTVTMLGGYASCAITALTAQNTTGVSAIHPVPPDFVRAQMEAVLGDLGADAVKTGMLGTGKVVEAVADVLEEIKNPPPVVADPVLVAKGGARLLDDAGIAVLRDRLLPLSAVLTPNVPEAEVLSGVPIRGPEDMEKAGRKLVQAGAKAVLVKGAHLAGEEITDLLVSAKESVAFTSARIKTRHCHGTGCTLASAIAVSLASGLSLKEAVARARNYVLKAMAAAPGFGAGHGPMAHNFGRAFFD